jgi:ABC-type branched-subunit amino acid transport system substrate-binding protein
LRKIDLCILAALIAFPGTAAATEQRGVTATEIKLGQTMPYSGPVSAFSPLGKGEVGYFNMINEQGGINGRKIRFISLDDGYVPPKTVEQTRRLVEQDEIAAIFSSLGTAHNTATAKYLQSKKVPQLFIGSAASKFGDPQQYPNLVAGVQASFRAQARIYARHALAKNPQAKFAILAQNDDFGRDYVAGVKDILGDSFSTRATVATYEPVDPTIESQIVNLKATGADVLVLGATPKFAAQAIRRVYDVGWKPMFFLPDVSTWVSSVMESAGLEKGIGILSAAYVKDPNDPTLANDEDVMRWRAFMQKYVPDGDQRDQGYVNAYISAFAMEQVLKQAGDDLSSENILKEALNLKDLVVPMLLPGIKVNTSPTKHLPIEQMQMMRFDGKQWVRFGEVLDARE